MDLIGVAMIIGGLVGSTFATTSNGYPTNTQVTSFGNQPLFIIGVIIVSLSLIPYLVAWIGALVNLAGLQQWAWFVFMILFNWITLLLYVIVGPTKPSGIQSYAQPLPPQQQQHYPQQPQYNPQQPQNYPQPPQDYSQP